MDETIGFRIKQMRKKLGFTQAMLAQKAFVSESYMALIELDKRNPSTDIIKKIAEVLCVSTDYLLFGDVSQNEDILFKEWKKMTTGRSIAEIDSAQKIVRCFFEALDKQNQKN